VSILENDMSEVITDHRRVHIVDLLP